MAAAALPVEDGLISWIRCWCLLQRRRRPQQRRLVAVKKLLPLLLLLAAWWTRIVCWDLHRWQEVGRIGPSMDGSGGGGHASEQLPSCVSPSPECWTGSEAAHELGSPPEQLGRLNTPSPHLILPSLVCS